MWFGSKEGSTKINRPTTLNVKPITTIESISESLGTLGSGSVVIGQDEYTSDTDHTDLNSDFDEEELRKELMNDVSALEFIFH